MQITENETTGTQSHVLFLCTFYSIWKNSLIGFGFSFRFCFISHQSSSVQSVAQWVSQSERLNFIEYSVTGPSKSAQQQCWRRTEGEGVNEDRCGKPRLSVGDRGNVPGEPAPLWLENGMHCLLFILWMYYFPLCGINQTGVSLRQGVQGPNRSISTHPRYLPHTQKQDGQAIQIIPFRQSLEQKKDLLTFTYLSEPRKISAQSVE